MAFAYVTHEVRVVFGRGVLSELPGELARAGFRDPLLITTPGRSRERATVAGLLEAASGAASGGTRQFSGARPHVPADVVREAREAVERLRPASLLAVGGGSAIGVGKALAHATGLTLAAVATTYSGSEMTAIWGTTEGGLKHTYRNAEVAPRLVLYDPDLTVDLSPDASAASGMNAIAHGVEAEYAPEAGPVTTWFASEGIRLLAAALPAIGSNPGDQPARHDALLGAHYAGRALDMTSMGLHHKLAHILGGSFGLDHARAHAALLPWVAAWNAPAALAAMARIARALGAPDAPTGLLELSRRLGIRTLGGLGFTAVGIPRAAEIATGLRFPNPRPVDAEGVRWILERAM